MILNSRGQSAEGVPGLGSRFALMKNEASCTCWKDWLSWDENLISVLLRLFDIVLMSHATPSAGSAGCTISLLSVCLQIIL